jgi:membrane associated rhomboid family serine protease
MEELKPFKFKNSVLVIPFFLVFAIWLVYWIEIKFGFNFNKYGVLPRTISGLKGVLFSPFIHSGTSHLINNSIPLFVLTASLFFFYNKIASKILLYGTILTGILTWTIAREAYHIGASGVVYLLFSFIFFSGIIRKHFRLTALSLAVIFLYGSMIWYVFPIKEKISWEGHLSGFIVGLVLAYFYKGIGPQKPVHVFKETEFDSHFDEDGNFAPKNEAETEGLTDS